MKAAWPVRTGCAVLVEGVAGCAERKGAAGVIIKQIPEGSESSAERGAERERKYDRRYSVFKEPEGFRITYRFNL